STGATAVEDLASHDRLRALAQGLARQVQERTQALRDSEDFTRLALTAVGGVGVWTYRVDVDRFFCDAAISELYGLDPVQAAAGIRTAEFLANVHPDDRARLRATMSGGLERSGDLELEYRIRHPDGSVRWVLSRGHTYFDGPGQPVRRTGVGIETTTRRLLEEQLRQSQKMEAVGQLTGGIAHDFNNLLASISGSLQLLKTRLGQGRVEGFERYVGVGEDSVRRAAALTQRLLAFSRRQTLDPKPADVNRLIAGMEDLISRSVGPAVEVEVVGAARLWAVEVDAPQLENTLLNLCINARDAMPDGGRLTIETANKWLDDRAAAAYEVPKGQYVSLSVTDTGIGMPEAVVRRVFDPFFTTKPMGQGTGLGLSMVYGFVRQSGGQVRVYSEVGQGTTMCVYLPRHVGDARDVEAEPAPAPIGAGDGETVLIVEDEDSIRFIAAEALGGAGYRVLEARDGPTALRTLQGAGRVDLLITDVGLPGGLNGRQVADAARVARPGLKVLFITGYADNAAVGNGHLERGMEVLTKPFELVALASKARELLDSTS
ncbi:MAG: ATP-binding protein, partial [Pseudomonadota bacterium]